jgi:hypothetical protein
MFVRDVFMTEHVSTVYPYTGMTLRKRSSSLQLFAVTSILAASEIENPKL